MVTDGAMLQRYADLLHRANRAAAQTDLEGMLMATLDLLISCTNAEAGILHLYDAESREVFFEVVQRRGRVACVTGNRSTIAESLVEEAMRANRVVLLVDEIAVDGIICQSPDLLFHLPIRTFCCVPLRAPSHSAPVGVVQLLNSAPALLDNVEEQTLLLLIGERLATDIAKMRLLADSLRREHHMEMLIDIASNTMKNLEPDRVLDGIMRHTRDLLEVEATSIWLCDEETHELEMYVAVGERSSKVLRVRVPEGQGIIGQVVRTGRSIIVNDVRTSEHFYRGVDQRSGFETRAVLCVPLRAPRIQLGSELGEVPETIIGGVQALNKCNGRPFGERDIYLLETLSRLSAAVLQFARLYEETHTLFWGFVNVITSAIDLKDPWMRDHSKRVSEVSVALARELPPAWWPEGHLSPQMLYFIRVGSMLHDIGKIRVGDAILNKPDQLTPDEMCEMRRHPVYGVDLLANDDELSRILREALPALLEHHERMDGSGYPYGLVGDQISHIGRIVAVADTFEAITSDRPYRRGRSISEALAILQAAAGTEFDAECVEALVRVCQIRPL